MQDEIGAVDEAGSRPVTPDDVQEEEENTDSKGSRLQKQQKPAWLAEFISSLGRLPKTYVKLLITQAASGGVIGRNGATIGEFHRASRARIQLSRTREYFPGTCDRVLLVSGRLNNVLVALEAILGKLIREKAAPLDAKGPPAGEDGPTLLLRLLVPGPLCGIVIGAQGATVRSIMEQTQAAVRVADDDLICSNVLYRAVCVSGTVRPAVKALALVVSRLSDDPKYRWYQELAPPAQQPPGRGGSGSGRPHKLGTAASSDNTLSSDAGSGGEGAASAASGGGMSASTSATAMAAAAAAPPAYGMGPPAAYAYMESPARGEYAHQAVAAAAAAAAASGLAGYGYVLAPPGYGSMVASQPAVGAGLAMHHHQQQQLHSAHHMQHAAALGSGGSNGAGGHPGMGIHPGFAHNGGGVAAAFQVLPPHPYAAGGGAGPGGMAAAGGAMAPPHAYAAMAAAAAGMHVGSVDQVTRTTLDVPQAQVAALLADGGEELAQIRQMSQASIKVIPPSRGSAAAAAAAAAAGGAAAGAAAAAATTRKVNITGTPPAVQAAIALLQHHFARLSLQLPAMPHQEMQYHHHHQHHQEMQYHHLQQYSGEGWGQGQGGPTAGEEMEEESQQGHEEENEEGEEEKVDEGEQCMQHEGGEQADASTAAASTAKSTPPATGDNPNNAE